VSLSDVYKVIAILIGGLKVHGFDKAPNK